MTDIEKAARDYRELQNEAETLKAQITAHMDAENTDTLQADIFTIRWTPYTATRIDTAAIKSELPDIAARYTKTVETRRFQVAHPTFSQVWTGQTRRLKRRRRAENLQADCPTRQAGTRRLEPST